MHFFLIPASGIFPPFLKEKKYFLFCVFIRESTNETIRPD